MWRLPALPRPTPGDKIGLLHDVVVATHKLSYLKIAHFNIVYRLGT